jgi:hypothetical protein
MNDNTNQQDTIITYNAALIEYTDGLLRIANE